MYKKIKLTDQIGRSYDYLLSKQKNFIINLPLLQYPMLFPIDHITLPSPQNMHLQKTHSKSNKPNQTFTSTSRFFKNKNIIQSNKQNLQTLKNHFTFRQTTSDLTNHHSLFKQFLPNPKQQTRFQRSSYNKKIPKMSSTQRFSFTPSQSCLFSPKIKDKIIQKYKQPKNIESNAYSPIKQVTSNPGHQEKSGLTKLLRKNNLYGQRCLLGKNIPKIQETYSFSRFQLFNMYTHYKTLIQSVKSLEQMRKGFQSILYINKIELNSQMIDQMFNDFSKNISFNHFIRVYGNIQNLLFTQNIIEYIKEVFTIFYRDEIISPEKVFQTLKEKMEESDAIEVKKMVYSQLNLKEQSSDISVKLIIKACQQNLLLCKRIFNSMNKVPANGNRQSNN